VFGGSALACRLTDDQLLLLGSTPSTADLEQRLGNDPASLIERTDVTSAYAGFVVLGPRLEDLLRRVTSLDVRLSAFPENTCAEAALARVEALLARPRGTSLPALRIYVAWDLAVYVWERMMQAGRDLSITAIGLEALGHLAG
jgi:heterotetrameric sarcosine oxidase gamma subunit